jgi:putative ABC transport system permease protein
VAQFSLSIVLLLGTLVIYQQLHFIHNKGLGFDINEIVYFPIKENIGTQFQVLHSELLASAAVVSVTAHSYNFATSVNRAAGWDWEGRDPDQEDSLDLILSGVHYDFFKTLDIKISEGRSFSRQYSTDPKKAYMLNQAAVKAMQLKKPVGTGFFWPEREGSIIGVVEDVHFRSLNWEIAPRLYYMTDVTQATGRGIVLVKFQGADRHQVLSRLERVWEKINPLSPFEYSFLDQTYDSLYRKEQQTVLIFNIFTVLAIFISCLGLFGLALFMTEQRTKEIGIRKVLGAPASNIVMLLSRDFVKWVLFANAIAWPLGYYAMLRLLEPYAYRTRISPLLFLLSGLLSLLIAWLTVSVQSWKAASAHPADSLRWE